MVWVVRSLGGPWPRREKNEGIVDVCLKERTMPNNRIQWIKNRCIAFVVAMFSEKDFHNS